VMGRWGKHRWQGRTGWNDGMCSKVQSSWRTDGRNW